MSETNAPASVPAPMIDFDKAEAGSAAAAALRCAACSQPIASTYYGVNGRSVCSDCHARLLSSAAARGSFLAAFGFGGAAAIAGALLYAGIVALTGYELGLIAIVVGYFVGKGVRRGAGLRTGKRYRALAIVLAYLSITATYIPMILKSEGFHSVVGAAILAVVMPGLMLAQLENVLGLVILAIGVYEAWKHSAAPVLAVEGPFTLQAPAAAPSADVHDATATATLPSA